MDVLRNARMEKFCQIIALEDCDASDAAFRAGYGVEQHPVKDQYHTNIASRLLKREDVTLRINTIRQQNADKDKAFTNSLINNLKRIISFDTAQYVSSNNVVLNNGRTVTDYYLSKPIQNWSPADRALMCNGFDSQGRPRFIDKQWAWEKLLKIYNLDGKSQVDIEDMLSLFAGAGLPVGKPNDGVADNVGNIDLNATNQSIDEELKDEEDDLNEE